MIAIPTAACFAVLAYLALATMASSQPFSVNTPQFEPGILEPQQRLDINYTGLTFNFNNVSGQAPGILTQSPGGMQQGSAVNTNPFVSTLFGDGASVVLVTLGPCAANTPHSHPRGQEISTVISGPPFQFGLIEEDQANNTLILRNLTTLETIHIPQVAASFGFFDDSCKAGLIPAISAVIHFAFNPNCQPVTFVANLGTTDPGIQTTYNSLTSVPNNILHAATGIPEANWATLKKQYPLVTTPGTGDQACMAKCGLNFLQSNKLTPVPNPDFSSTA